MGVKRLGPVLLMVLIDRPRGNGHKLQRKKLHLSMKRSFFILGLVKHWNKLPREVKSPSLQSKPAWMPSSAGCSRWPFFGGGLVYTMSRGPLQPTSFLGFFLVLEQFVFPVPSASWVAAACLNIKWGRQWLSFKYLFAFVSSIFALWQAVCECSDFWGHYH